MNTAINASDTLTVTPYFSLDGGNTWTAFGTAATVAAASKQGSSTFSAVQLPPGALVQVGVALSGSGSNQSAQGYSITLS